MATQLQIRRGTSTQVAAFTGAEGEIVVNTTNDSVHVNDGSTQGGFELARVDGSNWAITNNISTTGSLTGTTATFATADNSTQLTLKSTDGDANAGPVFDLVRDSASPADSDVLGRIRFRADNDAGEETTMVYLQTYLHDASDGSEDGGLDLFARLAGSLTRRITINTSGEICFNEDSNDIDFRVESDNNTHMLFVDGGNNRVGVGQSSPSAALHVKNTTSASQIKISDATNTSELQVASNGFYFNNPVSAGTFIFRNGTGLTERMRLTSTGLGIGTSSPDTLLELVGADPILTIRDSSTSSASGIATIRLAESGASDSLDQYFDIRANAGKLEIVDNWNEGGGTGTRVTLDDAGRVGIGTTTASTKLTVAGDITVTSTGPSIFLTDTDSNPDYQIKNGNGTLRIIDTTNSTDRLNIDSSGNLLVATTNNSPVGNNVAGVGLMSNGSAQLSRDGGAPLFVNRKTSNGDLIILRKDGSTVGTQGAIDGDLYVTSSASGHKGLRFGNGYIGPTNNAGTIQDNSTDLGISSHRFKNLYLSGGVYLGGTGSANELSDYEEGSFTPALNGFTGTYVHQIGQYRKVGGLVTAAIHIHISSTGGSGAIIVTGLPFTQTSTNRYGGATALHCNVWATSTKPDNVLVNPGTTVAPFYRSQGQTGIAVPQLSDMGTGNILCVFVYMTAQ